MFIKINTNTEELHIDILILCQQEEELLNSLVVSDGQHLHLLLIRGYGFVFEILPTGSSGCQRQIGCRFRLLQTRIDASGSDFFADLLLQSCVSYCRNLQSGSPITIFCQLNPIIPA